MFEGVIANHNGTGFSKLDRDLLTFLREREANKKGWHSYSHSVGNLSYGIRAKSVGNDLIVTVNGFCVHNTREKRRVGIALLEDSALTLAIGHDIALIVPTEDLEMTWAVRKLFPNFRADLAPHLGRVFELVESYLRGDASKTLKARLDPVAGFLGRDVKHCIKRLEELVPERKAERINNSMATQLAALA